MDGAEPEYIENIAVSDMAGYIRQYGEDGYDLVIIHGAQFEAAAVETAPLYPEHQVLPVLRLQDRRLDRPRTSRTSTTWPTSARWAWASPSAASWAS